MTVPTDAEPYRQRDKMDPYVVGLYITLRIQADQYRPTPFWEYSDVTFAQLSMNIFDSSNAVVTSSLTVKTHSTGLCHLQYATWCTKRDLSVTKSTEILESTQQNLLSVSFTAHRVTM